MKEKNGEPLQKGSPKLPFIINKTGQAQKVFQNFFAQMSLNCINENVASLITTNCAANCTTKCSLITKHDLCCFPVFKMSNNAKLDHQVS